MVSTRESQKQATERKHEQQTCELNTVVQAGPSQQTTMNPQREMRTICTLGQGNTGADDETQVTDGEK